MNIFVLDENPQLAAIYHNDKHCVKMILETAQILSTAHRVLDAIEVITIEYTPVTFNKNTKKFTGGKKRIKKHYKINSDLEPLLYKVTHINHPCCIWARKTSDNYLWLYQLFSELCKEYTYRYNKIHKCEIKLLNKLNQLPKNIPIGSLTPFAQAINNDKCIREDSVEAYRMFYMIDKRSFCVWKNRETPTWFKK